MADKDLKSELNKLADSLRDPLRLRMLCCGIAVAATYFGISEPLHGKLNRTERLIRQTEQNQQTADDIKLLKIKLQQVEPHLIEGGTGAVTQHLIDTIRTADLDLQRIDGQTVVSVGPLQAIRVRVSVAGTMNVLDALVSTLETSKYLTRIESIMITPASQQESDPTLQMTILMMGEPE